MPHAVKNADLCALMDGECRPEERNRVKAELAASPQCAERLALWRRNDAALRFAISGGAATAPREPATPPPLIEAAPVPPPRIKEPLTDGPPADRARNSVSRSAHAAAISAFAGGAGASLVALAVLFLAR